MSFDVDRPWALHDRVAIRPESFGALAYHYGTRRLSFLKHPLLVRVVEALGEHGSAAETLRTVGVSPAAQPAFVRALATLADTDMIVARGS
jgi:putative mycofactocin binding protein MftB